MDVMEQKGNRHGGFDDRLLEGGEERDMMRECEAGGSTVGSNCRFFFFYNCEATNRKRKLKG